MSRDPEMHTSGGVVSPTAEQLELGNSNRKTEVATQDVVFVLTRLFSNPTVAPKTWNFVRQKWPRLRRRMPSLLAGRLIEATPLLGTKAHRREVAEFFRSHPVPSGDRALKQALERFDSWARFQRTGSRELELYLDRE